MTLVAYLAGSDEAHRVRLGRIGLTSRADGSVGYGGLVFDDPTKTLTTRGWMDVEVHETDCVSAPVLYHGLLGPREIKRALGDDGNYRDALGRTIDATIIDPNDVATFRMFVNPDAKRPAEGDDDRIAWALGSGVGGLAGLVDDDGLVNTAPNPFQESDYRGRYAADAIEDMADALGKIKFVYTDAVDGTWHLFYDFPTATVETSTLSISNDMGDASSTCFYPLLDAVQGLDPSEMASVVRYVYLNGVVLEGLPSTQLAFFSAAATGGVNLGDRGIEITSDRVGAVTTARHHAQVYLQEHSVERDTITVSIIVPSTQVGLIRAGQRIHNRFTHLDGHESFVYSRIQSVNIGHWVNNKQYLVTLELTNAAGRGTGGGGGTGGVPLPPPVAQTLAVVQAISRQSYGGGDTDLTTYPALHSWVNPTAGNLLVLGVTAYDNGGAQDIPAPAGWTAVDAIVHPTGFGTSADYSTRMFYKAASGSETIFNVATGYDEQTVVLVEFNGPGTLVDSVVGNGVNGGGHSTNEGNRSAAPVSAGPLVTTAGDPVMTVGFWALTGPTGLWTTVWGGTIDQSGGFEVGHPSAINLGSAFVVVPVATATGSERVTGTMYDNNNFPYWTVAAFSGGGGAADNPPQPGQWVDWAVVTMTTSGGVSVGTTLFPYADRSLQVKVDGVLISPASYAETDPATGAFALSWLLDPSEVVQVRYQGR